MTAAKKPVAFAMPETRVVVKYAIFSSYPKVWGGKWYEESVCETMERALTVIAARASRRTREGAQRGRFMVVQQTTTVVYSDATPVEAPTP